MKKLFAPIAGMLIFLAGSWLNYRLLAREMISSGDFVTLELAVMVASLLIALISNISEISSASFVVKIREAKAEAEVTVQKLESLVVAAFEPQLIAARKAGGGYSDARAIEDARVAGFIALLDSIDRAGLTKELAVQIKETAEYLALAQLQKVRTFAGNEELFGDLLKPLSPSSVRSMVSELGNTEDAADRFYIPIQEIEQKLGAAIQSYEKLYNLATKAPSARHTGQPS